MTGPLRPAPPPPRDPAWSTPSARPGGDLLVPFSLADGVALVVWSLLGQVVVVSIVLLGLGLAGVAPTGLRGPSLGAVTVVTQSLVLAGALAWLAGRGRLTWRLFGAVRPAARHVAQGLGGGLLALALSTGVILLGGVVFGPLEDAGQALLEQEMLTGTALVLTFVAASLLAPLLEEVTFRGVLFQALGRRVGWVGGVVGSSVLFTVVHIEVLLPPQVESVVFGVALFLVGATFAVLFHRTRSLLTAIVAHATFNGVQLVLASQTTLVAGFAAGGLGA